MNEEFSSVKEPGKPVGWPRWLWFIVCRVVPMEHRTELMSPDQRAQTVRVLADKVKYLRERETEWRDRTFAAEQRLSNMNAIIKETCQQHNNEHGTILGW